MPSLTPFANPACFQWLEKLEEKYRPPELAGKLHEIGSLKQ
ncbi:hypothetical protein [Sphingomonas sp.]|nr:hypothetical protein [Sphingomonas sp.]